MTQRKELLTAKMRILLTTACLIATTIFAQEKLQIAEPGQILANPDSYQGKVIALHGVIDKISLEQRTFTMIDLNLAGSAASTNARSVVVTDQGENQIAMQKSGQEAVVIGQIAGQDSGTNFAATQVFTNKQDVQQILAKGSIVRPPGKRPGDNLGRDTHPASNLDR